MMDHLDATHNPVSLAGFLAAMAGLYVRSCAMHGLSRPVPDTWQDRLPILASLTNRRARACSQRHKELLFGAAQPQYSLAAIDTQADLSPETLHVAYGSCPAPAIDLT